MKKLLVALALLTVSTVGLAVEVVENTKGMGIYIVDGKKVFKCGVILDDKGCYLISSDYRKPISEDPAFEKTNGYYFLK